MRIRSNGELEEVGAQLNSWHRRFNRHRETREQKVTPLCQGRVEHGEQPEGENNRARAQTQMKFVWDVMARVTR